MKVGVDLIEIERIRRALDRYPRFRERCFTEAERAYCESRPNPAQSYAGRFAGKEAVGKALDVEAKYDFNLNIPFAKLGTIPIAYKSSMRNE